MIHAIGTLTNSNISNLRYSTSIYKNNLEYGVVAMATLQITATSPLTVSDGTTHLPAYTYTVDGVQAGVFYCRRCVKTGDSYSITLYDAACWLSTDDRQTYSNDTTCYHYYNAAGQLTTGTYSTNTPTTISDNEYFTADVGMDDSAGYHAISVHMPAKHDLTFGDKFKLGDDISYVQSISWDISTYTIAGQTDDADNSTTIESTLIRQGSLITALTVETGLIEAKVERKNAVYKQSTQPADTEGTGEDTKYDLLNTGDIWYYTGTTTSTYTNGKWYACTATGTHEGGDRAITWTETTDAQITNNSSRLTVAEGQIQSKVSQLTYNNDINAAGGLKERMTSAETSITQTAEQLTLKASKTEAQGYASTAEDNAKGYADDVGETAEGNAKNYTDGVKTTLEAAIDINASNISAEVTRATTAEAGKIDSTGTLTKTGMSWNLTNSDWTVNTISGGTTTAVLKVDNSGLTINGKGTFNGNVMVPNAAETFNCVQVYGPYTGVPAGTINTSINRSGMSIIDSPTTSGFPIYYTNYTKSGMSVSKSSGTYTDAKLTCENLVCSGAVRNSAPPSEGQTEANVINGTIRFYWQ